MYGLQTAPSPRRTNCKIQRNIGNQHHDCSSIKETNFFFGVILDENLNWNSHNSNFSQLKFCHSISYIFLVFFFLKEQSLTLTPTPTLTLGVTLTLVFATPTL